MALQVVGRGSRSLGFPFRGLGFRGLGFRALEYHTLILFFLKGTLMK